MPRGRKNQAENIQDDINGEFSEFDNDEFQDNDQFEEGFDVDAASEDVIVSKPGPKPKATSKPKPKGEYFEEWKCELHGKKPEKLKPVREVVKIRADEANTLNRSALDSGEKYVIMYFRPGK